MEHTEFSETAAMPKMLKASASNFVRVPDFPFLKNGVEAPMLLNAWTQTTGEDFDILQGDALLQKEQEFKKREQQLLQRIEYLEQSTRKQAEVLSQIHATTNNLHLPLVPVQQKLEMPVQTQYSAAYMLPTTAVINNAFPVQSYATTAASSSSYKYTIIQQADSGADAPIEFQLEEDVNLNCSADSTRLAICLEDESGENAVKTESKQALNTSVSPSALQQISNNLTANDTEYNTMLFQKKKLALKRKHLPEPNTPAVANYDQSEVFVSLGPNETRILAKIYDSINWNNASLATRKLLVAAFDRETLATSTMTGKPSPAFSHKPGKNMLNQKIVADIIYAVTRKCNVSEKEVRNAITTKCADENKMSKMKRSRTELGRMLSYNEEDKENNNNNNHDNNNGTFNATT